MGKNPPAPIRSIRAAVTEARAVNRDEVLESIEGQTVVVLGVEIEHVTGRWSSYDLATVILEDERSFKVAGKAVCGPLSEVDWSLGPITGTFRRVESSYDPGKASWTVEQGGGR